MRLRPTPLIATLAAIVLGVSLGQWQMRRAAEKTAIEQRMSERERAAPVQLSASPGNDAQALEYRKVRLRGQFLADWPVYLENRPYRGSVGVFVVMPFQLAGSNRHVLVERGWIARDGTDRTRLPVIATPEGEIELAGSVRRSPGKVLQLGEAPTLRPGAFVQNLEVAGFASASGLQMEDFVIEQSSTTADGLVRDWPRPSSGVERHYGYAFQWYALAATAFIFFVVTGIRRGPRQPARSKPEP